MQGYYEQLRAQYGDLSCVPDIQAGRMLTNEDSTIWHALQFSKRSREYEACYTAQAVRIMDQGLELIPFRL